MSESVLDVSEEVNEEALSQLGDYVGSALGLKAKMKRSWKLKVNNPVLWNLKNRRSLGHGSFVELCFRRHRPGA